MRLGTFLTSERLYEIALFSVQAVAAIYVFLLAVIVVNKAWRESREGFAARRRRELEPALFRYAMGTGAIETFLPAPLARREWPVVEQVFFDLLRTVRGNVSDRAREVFERLGIVDFYLARLTSRSWWLRAEAAEKLGLMGSPKAVGTLIRAMNDVTPEVRLRAAQALGNIGTPDALRPLALALRDTGRWSAIRVSTMLIAAGDDAVDVLLEEFDRLPIHAKVSAIDIFGRIKSLRPTPLLRQLLKDPQPDLRARAAHALGMIGDPTAAPLLVETLRDPAWSARAMAARALGRLREASSIGALSQTLSDPQWWVRANAAEALKTKGAAGQEALLALLDSDDPYAAQQSVQMLQESGVLDAFVGMLTSTAPGEQARAIGVMTKLVKLRRTELLGELARNHPDAQIRGRLVALLGLPAAT